MRKINVENNEKFDEKINPIVIDSAKEWDWVTIGGYTLLVTGIVVGGIAIYYY